MKKPVQIVRKSDFEVFELRPKGKYVNPESFKMGSIMEWDLEHFSRKYFTFIYD